MPTWVKVAIDTWTTPAGVVEGHVFRSVNRGGQVQHNVLSEKVVWQMLRPYAAAAGMPGIAPHDCGTRGRAPGAKDGATRLLYAHQRKEGPFPPQERAFYAAFRRNISVQEWFGAKSPHTSDVTGPDHFR